MPTSKAEADLARVQADIRRLETQLEEARSRATKIAHYIEMAKLYESGQSAAPALGRGSGGRAAAATQMAMQILRERKHRLHTKELLDEMKQRGVIFDSQNPVTNLSSVLSRSAELTASRSKGWGLVEWQTPDLGEELDHPLGVVSAETTDGRESEGYLEEVI